MKHGGGVSYMWYLGSGVEVFSVCDSDRDSTEQGVPVELEQDLACNRMLCVRSSITIGVPDRIDRLV